MPEEAVADAPQITSLPETEPKHEGPIEESYVSNIMDSVFKGLGGKIEPKVEKEETPVEKDSEKEPVVESEPEKEKEEVAPEPEVAPAATTDIDPEEKRQNTWNKLKKEAKEAERLRAEREEWIKEKASVESQRSEYEAIKQQLEEVKRERESIDGELYKSRIQSSSVYKDKVIKPYMQIEAAAEHFAKENELDSKEFLSLLVRGDKKAFKESIAGIDDFERFNANTMFQDMRRIEYNRDQLFEDSRATVEREARQAKEQSELSQRQVSEKRAATMQEIIPKFTESVFGLLPEDKRMDLNKVSSEITGFDSWDDNLKMYAGSAAIALPNILESYKAVSSQLKEAKAEISKLRKGAPKVGSGTAPSASKESAQDNKPTAGMSYDEFAKQAAERIRASAGLS
jgi:hypothetical protein